MGGKGSGQFPGCGVGKGKCGVCGDLQRRGTRGHFNYYCGVTGKRIDRQTGCPKIIGVENIKPRTAKPKPRARREPKIEYKFVRVENPRPGVRVEWVKTPA